MGNKVIDPNFIDDEKLIPKTNLLKIIDKGRSGSKHRKDSIKLSKIRKNTIHKNKDEDKEEEKVGRKSIHRITKKNNSSKKNIKIEDGSNKNNIKITTNINTIKNSGINSPNKNQGKIISDFPKENELNLNLNDSIKNININEILNDKKEEEKEQDKIKKNILLKELEEYNDKKPRIEESKNMEMKRTRSRSKNKDDDINEIKEMEGSLNDMQITLEGLNILKRPDNKKIKFEKKKKTEKEITRENIMSVLQRAYAVHLKNAKDCEELIKLDKGEQKKCREKIYRMILETETYYPTLLRVVKHTPEYNDAAWLLQYQMESMLDIYKRLM